tara:strand:+ start:103 stop:972 length:870 start_codon:yes stop_codon:yes gene_type:complete
MNKNIVYCLCSYLNEQLEQKFIDIVIQDYKNVFNKLDIPVDFKVITTIPPIINDAFEDIKCYYKNKNTIERERWVSRYSKQLFRLIETVPDEDLACYGAPRNEHSLKAWNTKFHIIEDFFNSNYEAMVYLDCDLGKLTTSKLYKHRFTFNEEILGFTPHWDKRGKREHVVISKKYLPHINDTKFHSRFIKGGSFYINKKKSFNIENILTIENVVNLWKKDSWFLREEIALTYLFHKYNLIDKIKCFPLSYKHLGRWCDKLHRIDSIINYNAAHPTCSRDDIWSIKKDEN